jgi:hypothetical protein
MTGAPPPSDRPKTFLSSRTYAAAIADGANRWAYLEYYINKAIWELAGVKPALGACLTSQMYTLNAKLNALLALLKLRKADSAILTSVNKFAASVRDALEARNRIVHDVWMNNNFHPDVMGKMRVTADKQLVMKIENIELSKLQADVQLIEKRRLEAGEIEDTIRRALPSLPEMSQGELYPIVETPSDQS